jgi:peptide/nickel transport system ATP-binding protein
VSEPLLSVRDLGVEFRTSRGVVQAVGGVSFDIYPGEVFGLVGETGCGKTVTGLSILRLIAKPGRISAGRILLQGEDLLAKSEQEMQHIRGGRVSMIFQDPTSSLNPVFTVGSQIVRVIRQHQGVGHRVAVRAALEVLQAVGLPDPPRLLDSYPHELSGGMQQRVMIAMALSCRPLLLIADEPTTALDVTIEAQILELLREVQARFGIAIMLITHDLGIIAETCDRLAVLYAGRVAEMGPTEEVFNAALHPYTRGLMGAIPRPDSKGRPLAAIHGTVPSNPGAIPGCAYASRCPIAAEHCPEAPPPLVEARAGHFVACLQAGVQP